MAGLFDDLGGALQQGEQKVGSFLQGMLPKGQGQPSAPAKPSSPPLPKPQVNPTQPLNTPLAGMVPRPLQQLGDFFKGTGVTQLATNMFGGDTTNKNTLVGGIADPNNPVNQVRNQVKNNPVSNVAQHVTDILNAGVVKPIQYAGDPQSWFWSGSDQTPHLGNLFNIGGNKNYVRDVFGPLIKKTTGENVPDPVYSFQGRAQALTAEGQKLQQAQDSLTPQSSQTDIDAYNSKLQQYNADVSRYQKDYTYSQDWWTNSSTAKTLRTLGQIAVFPAGFAAGAATFVPQLIADPIGTGEGMIGSVQQGVDFVGILMDPKAREQMTPEEWAANIQNILGIATLLYGAKHVAGDMKAGSPSLRADLTKFKDTRGASLLPGYDTILGRKLHPETSQLLKQEMHDSVPELKNPDQAPSATISPIDPRSPAAQANAHIEQRMLDASQLRDELNTTEDPAHKALLIKQINDITDEIQNVRQQSKQYAKAAVSPEPGTMFSDDSNNSLVQRIKYYQDQIKMYEDALKPALPGGPEPEDAATLRDTIAKYRNNLDEAQTALKQSPETRNQQVSQDLGRELTTEQRPQYTQPVYPNSGSPEGQVDTLLRSASDFTRSAIQQTAMRRRPQDYASPSSSTGELPNAQFETLDPNVVENMAQSNGLSIIPVNQVRSSAWVDPRTGKAIDVSSLDDTHGEFAAMMTLPGDMRSQSQVVEDMLNQGWIKVSYLGEGLPPTYAVDMLDPENMSNIQKMIVADMNRKIPSLPYQVVETANNRAYYIRPAELATNNFNLAKTIMDQRRIMPRSETGEEKPRPVPEKLTSSEIRQAVEYQGWKLVPYKNVEYGWLFPGGKGTDIGLSTTIRGAHYDLLYGLDEALNLRGSDGPFGALSAQELQRVSQDWVQLRRGYAKDTGDHFFFAEKWTPTTLKIVEDYLNSESKYKSNPSNIILESRGDTKAIGAVSHPSDTSFTWDEFKNNDFKLQGLLNRRNPNPLAPYSQAGEENMGPWLYDRFTTLQKARNQLNFFENRNARQDRVAIQKTLDTIYRTITDLPEKVPAHLAAIRDELQGVLNEKGYPADVQTDPESATGQTSQGYNQAPPGAPEGSTLTSVVSVPGKGQVAIWQTDPKSAGTLSAFQRGRVELAQSIKDFVTATLRDNPDAEVPAGLKNVSVNPANVARRTQEAIAAIKNKMPDLDPLGFATIKHVVFDPNLKVEAQYDPYSGMITVNPARGIPESWIRGAGVQLGSQLARWKREKGGEVPSVDALQYAKNWIDEITNLPQAQRDWGATAEEILHKYDTDYLNIGEYFNSLLTLPTEWWEHAIRSGLADNIEGGLNFFQDGKWIPILDTTGVPVSNWIDAFNHGRMGMLDDASLQATFHVFAEYRVTQLRNYHGIPGSGYTYRVPEVFYREFQNPDLIREGSQIAGASFEQYVRTQTAPQLALPNPEEEAALSQRTAEAGTPPEFATSTGAAAAVPATTATGVGGYEAANQRVAPGAKAPEQGQDYPQIGDQLQVNLGTNEKPNWVNFLPSALRNQEDIQKAAQTVNTSGANLGTSSAALSTTSYKRQYRVVSPTGQARVFQGDVPGVESQGGVRDFNQLPSFANERETPTSFHGIPVPEVAPPVEGDLGNRAAQAGFNKRALRLAQEQTPNERPIAQDIPDSIGSKMGYQPLVELGKTGYPGNWDDFLAAMSQEPDTLARKMAQPYWDKLDPKYQQAFMEAMQESGVQQAVMERQANPRVQPVAPDEVNSPTFLARQAKIQDYQQKIAASGPTLDKLRKSINTEAGLEKYARAKATIAAMQKYVTIDPGVVEKEALQMAGMDYSRTFEEITKEQPSTPVPEKGINTTTPTRDLLRQLQPVIRNFIQSRVTMKDVTGKLGPGSYRTLEQFVDAFAGGEEDAKKLYNKLPKTSKDAVRSIVAQMPTSFKLPGRARPDQTSIPASQQASQEHINPSSPEDVKALVENSTRTLVRHGSTEYNERGLVRAHDNPPLSSLGRLQARNIGRAFRGMRNLKIVTHDLSRAYDTAKAIAEAARGSRVTVDEDLRPWNVGKALTGTSVTAANPRMQRMMFEQPDFVPEGGESFNQFKTRYLTALRKYIYDYNVIVGSTRNLRLAEGWITKGAPADLSFDESALQTAREIGPGGVLGITHQKDGTLTVSGKASQMPSEAANVDIPQVQSNAPLRSGVVTAKGSQPGSRVNQATIDRTMPGLAQNAPSKVTLRMGDKARQKAADAQGEVLPRVAPDVKDELSAVIADPSVLGNDPLKSAAVMAKDAIDNVDIARQVQVPAEQLRAQIADLEAKVERFARLRLERAQVEAKAAEQFAPQPKNKAANAASLKEAKAHQSRIAQGEDYNVSAHKSAKAMGFKDITDARARIQDAASALLPDGHRAYSLAPAYKDIFNDPQAVELLKSENQAEPPKQGLLPLTPEVSTGATTPVPADPAKPMRMAFVDGSRARSFRINRAPVTPAAADHLTAHTPPPEVPAEVHPRVAAQRYKFKIKDHEGKSTKDLRDETTQVTEKINTPSPDFFHDEELGQLEEESEATFNKAKQGVPPDATAKVQAGGGGGKKPPTPINPLKGWDDSRDVLSSLGGKYRSLSLRYDYMVKMMTNLIDPSANAAHPVGMANALLHARTEAAYVGDEMHQLLQDLVPMKTEADLARHQAIAKAVGGEDESVRAKALRDLSDEDKAIANMLHGYHKVMGVLGARPESHLWDEAQSEYFPRRITGFNGEKIDPFSAHRNTAWAKKLGIMMERRKRTDAVGIDDNGNLIIKTSNFYKDNEALKEAGFTVDENVASLQKYHWDSFSNLMLTHQFIKVLSTLDNFEESSIRGGRFADENTRLKIGRNAAPYVGRILVPRMDTVSGKRRTALIDPKYRSQLTTVTRGPLAGALQNYLVYKPVADVLERMASSKAGDNFGEQIANIFAQGNNTFKIFKFGFNPIHLYNLLSNVYVLGTNGLLDQATYNPFSLAHRIYGRTEALLQDKTTFKDWNGQDITGKDMIAKIMHWGGVLPKDIIDVNNLGGLTGILARRVPGFTQWHNFMWQGVAWKGQIGLTLHLIDVMRNELESNNGLGRQLNEAEFENVGRLATQQAKYAMGFVTKEQMTRDWQIYGNSLFLANSWTLSQLRQLGMALPKGIPAAKYLANLGGGETYNDIVSKQMMELGHMNQASLEKINGYQGKFARKLMFGGAAKLLAMSTIITYLGSYFGNQGQAQGPWQNYQRDPTHTFDIYLGTDQQTGKDKWAHNPLFGMQQEMALYGLQAVKELERGGNPYDVLTSVGGRFTNKANPILSTTLDIAINRNLNLYLQGYGDRSDISADPNVIAITRALDATGKNPFPDSFTNNLVYAVRTLFPSPGFPNNLNTQMGTNPTQTNATLGNVLNALGAGKVAGIGDLINAAQQGPTSQSWQGLVKTDLGGLAQWMTGSRISTSSTPEQMLSNNAIGSSIATRDQKNQALADMARAAQAGDWKTVAQISDQLGLTNSQMVSALEHPPSGFGGGPGVLYNGLPTSQQVPTPAQDTLNGQELTPAQTVQLENMKEANTIAMLQKVEALPEFQSSDKTLRTSMMAAYVNMIDTLVNDQYAQQIGQTSGNPITNLDIQNALDNAIQFRRTAEDVLGKMQLYQQADSLEKQRMQTSFFSYAITLARDAAVGNLQGVPIQNVREILSYTINAEETTRSWLENTMYYQLAPEADQTRMLNEYQSLARTMAKREALGQGQGTYAFQIPPDKIIPTIEFIMSVEEAGKASLHSTDYYYNNPADQKALDTKYETLARGLAFSTSNADPRTLIENSLIADQSYYDLQNQFGGSSYIKLMAQQLTDLEHNVKVSANYSPQQIAAIERSVRAQFLAQNPAYAQFLRTRTEWQKNTTVGQLYAALNNSEYAALSDMQAAGVIPTDSLLLSGTSVDDSVPLDVTAGVGLPSVDYTTFANQNP